MNLRPFGKSSLGLFALMGLGLLLPQIASTEPLQRCEEYSTTTAHQLHCSGIAGQVMLSPLSPLARPGVVNERPYQATMLILNQAGKTVTKVQSDASGHFWLVLKPGKYTLRPLSPGGLPRAPEQSVLVTATGFTQVRIAYDSGIR